MSDVGTFSRLAPSQAQLPVQAYFNDALLAQERTQCFQAGPGYVGHRLMVPEPGRYSTLAHEDHGRVLVHGPHGIELLSNICRHRQAVMLEGQGQTESIVCPLHRWTYDLSGQLIGAPYFDQDPCRHLKRKPLTEWNGLLFEGQADLLKELSSVPFFDKLDFEGFVHAKTQVHHCDYNWKSFIEVYMDDYHVVPFHPGLGSFVDCDALRWHFGENFNIQAVGITPLTKGATPVYQRWQQEVLRMHDGQLPEYGAIWMTIYPNIMVEWYPKVLVVSHLHPLSPQKTLNVVEFYYPEEIALFEPTYMQAQQDAYNETVIEDDEIAIRMDRGRAALAKAGRNETGPYHSPMEDGMLHFHEYLRRQLGDQAFANLT
ncbi:MAG: aromatic ring-hydroxylating oxygenase subunit alpha [Burkholderiaceae bacterium]|jgi:phenylpropionate dioxygenase-like ring-hydroxylating dioxygenase large terminal subunit|nr:Rieske 2Fe-2S domain-containing protein [Burkholderiales bacterium LSUCC0115]